MALTAFEARFFDGKTARPHQVSVELHASRLRISMSGESCSSDWLYKNMAMRLYIEPENWFSFKTKLPKTAFPAITLSTRWRSLAGYAGLSVIFVLAAVAAGPRLFERASELIPPSTEIQIGKMALDSSINHPVCTAPQGKAALDKLVLMLKQGITRDIPFNVRVVSADETLNALAAPGGHLIIFSGILKKADSAEEVAGVLAHEMAHLEMNHPMKSLMRNLGVTLTLHMMFGDAGVLSNTAHFAGMIHQLHYSREDELEADKIGYALLEKANIDPSGLTLFFERIQQEETKSTGHSYSNRSDLDEYFSTHPHTEQRINTLKSNATTLKNYRQALDDSEWQALKDICSEQAD
jgi:predicted Zn-dependent protease